MNRMQSSVLIFALLIAQNLWAKSENKPLNVLRLENGAVVAEVTPDIGGRVLSFALAGKKNFLKTDDQVHQNPDPEVSATGENIGYFGHEVWVGPQSAWWTNQNVNKTRLTAKAVWPPDPYLVLAKHKVFEQNAKKIVLQGPASPISGVSLQKTYSLLKDRPKSLQLDVEARNIRDTAVAWDIWFNTRVHQDTLVYVPLASTDDLRIDNWINDVIAPLSYQLEKDVFILKATAPPDGKSVRRGKVFIQPSAGWMAGFHGDQAFIIQFHHQLKTAIHPEQGQIELYHDYQPVNSVAGVIEMELHAPYLTLQPDEAMTSREVWTILAYDGPHTVAGHLAFLRSQASSLGLSNL